VLIKYLQTSDVVAQVVEALRYKTQERGFNPDFSLTWSFLPHEGTVST